MKKKIESQLEEFQKLEKLDGKVIDRRTFLKIAASLGIVAIAGTAWYNSFSSSAKGKIVIVGGGAAGVSMAARLKNWVKDADITIIDPSEKQFYQPGFTMIAAGIYNAEEVWKSQKSCMPDDINWIKDVVVRMDPETNSVTTNDNGTIKYDFLVVAPGLQMNFDQVEGISRSTLGVGNAHCMYDYQSAQKVWPAIKKLSETGGEAIFTNTFTKHKCGGAPKKITMLTDDYCRKQGTRNNINIAYYNGSINLFDTPFYAKRLIEIFKDRELAHIPEHRLKGIDTQAKIATFIRKDGLEPINVPYEFMHFTPPMSAPDFVRESGLCYDQATETNGDWVTVDKGTMVHTKYKNIISLGDCSNLPTSKTSAAIRMQVPIAAKNLISLMEGKEPVETYDGYTACPIITEYGKVLMAEFDYDKNPMPTLPIIDSSHETTAAWILKKYMLKPIYFHGMLNGWM